MNESNEFRTSSTSADAQAEFASGRADSGLKEQAVAQVQSLADKARTAVEERIESATQSGKASAVGTLTGVAQALMVAGQDLQSQQNAASGLITQAAERIE